MQYTRKGVFTPNLLTGVTLSISKMLVLTMTDIPMGNVADYAPSFADGNRFQLGDIYNHNPIFGQGAFAWEYYVSKFLEGYNGSGGYFSLSNGVVYEYETPPEIPVGTPLYPAVNYTLIEITGNYGSMENLLSRVPQFVYSAGGVQEFNENYPVFLPGFAVQLEEQPEGCSWQQVGNDLVITIPDTTPEQPAILQYAIIQGVGTHGGATTPFAIKISPYLTQITESGIGGIAGGKEVLPNTLLEFLPWMASPLTWNQSNQTLQVQFNCEDTNVRGSDYNTYNYSVPDIGITSNIQTVDHFECYFDGNLYTQGVSTRTQPNIGYAALPKTPYFYDAPQFTGLSQPSPFGLCDILQSGIFNLLCPAHNPAGPIWVRVVYQDNVSMPWVRLWYAPVAVLDSPDGIGNRLGHLYTGYRSFGSSFPVTRLRWMLGFNEPMDNTLEYPDGSRYVSDDSLQSFVDAGVYFESDDINSIYDGTQHFTGPFNMPFSYTGFQQLNQNYVGIAPGADAVDADENPYFQPNWEYGWGWGFYPLCPHPDSLTFIEKYMHPSCPFGTVLSGNTTWTYTTELDPAGNSGRGITSIFLNEPVCIINGATLGNHSGWDGTSAKDGLMVALAFNRSIQAWWLYTGYRWEGMSFMSAPWPGAGYHLATVAVTLDGSYCTLAWTVEFNATVTPVQVAYSLWFKRSADSGASWGEAVEIPGVVASPADGAAFLARINQNLNNGRLEINGNTAYPVSYDGGNTWVEA